MRLLKQLAILIAVIAGVLSISRAQQRDAFA